MKKNYFELKIILPIKLSINCESEMQAFFRHSKTQAIYFQVPFLKQLPKDGLQQNKGRKQEGRRWGIRKNLTPQVQLK